MQHLPGTISISRVSSNQEPDYICVEIRDERAGVIVAMAKLPLENFAAAVTGLGHRPCELTFFDLSKVGMIRENKTETINFSVGILDARMRLSDEARAAMAPFEVDGWKGNPPDLANPHHRLSDGSHRVNFERWVQPPNGD